MTELLEAIEHELSARNRTVSTLARRLGVSDAEIRSALRVGFALGRIESTGSHKAGYSTYRLT